LDATTPVLLCVLLLASLSLGADRDVKVLMDSERAFATATAERGVDGWMEYMASNAVELMAEPLVGLDRIRAGVAKLFRLPGFKITWEPTKAEFLGEGDVGYAVGGYEVRFDDPGRKPVVKRGTYLITWQKQKDGTWKFVSAIDSPDPPAQ
jgi:ketosteroid isomerase-like protein